MYMMEHKKKPLVAWTQQPIYQELANAKLPLSIVKRVSQLKLNPRKEMLPDNDSSAESSAETSAEEARSRGASRRGGSRVKKARYSVLRPHGSKIPGKGTKSRTLRSNSKTHSSDHADEVEDIEDEEDDDDAHAGS